MSFLSNLLGVVATQIAIAPIVLVTQVLLARLLTVAGRGEYAVATELVMLTVAFVQLGWGPAAIYRIRSAGSAPALVASGALYAALLISAVTVILCLAFEAPIRERILPQEALFLLAVASVPALLLGQIFAGIARGLGRFDLSNAWGLAFPSLVLFGVAGLLYAADRTPVVAMTAYLIAASVSSAVLVVIVLRQTGLGLRVPVREVLATLGYGLKSHAQNVLTNVHQRIDVILLASLQSDLAAVGLYAVAVAIVNRIRIAPTAVAVAMFPTVAGASAQDSAEVTARVVRHTVPGILFSVVGMGAAGYWLVPLVFGKEYEGSVVPLLVLLPGTAFLGIQTILSRYFAARDRQSVMIGILAVGTAINIGANFVLIPRLAGTGAALASLLSYTFQGLAGLVAFWRSSGVALRQTLVLSRAELRGSARRLVGLLAKRRSGG